MHKRTKVGTITPMLEPVLSVRFFRTQGGNEPVREWLLELQGADRKTIGQDMKTVQFGWPLGMPLVRKLATNLWEVRVPLATRTARVLFTVEDGVMVLLHAFIKKSQATPRDDLELAKTRMKQLRS
jgi:phage-related protein